MAIFGDFFASCISDLHSKFAGHTMCQSMVNIQSPTAEIRRGKKEEKEEERRNSMKIP